jgi:hypothetical protein
MRMRVTFERNYALLAARNEDVDGFGQKVQDWREIGTWPCYAWAGKPRTTLRDVGLVTTDAPGMIVPLGADVVLGDRVQRVTDRMGKQLFGAMSITGIAPRATHVELQLETAA